MAKRSFRLGKSLIRLALVALEVGIGIELMSRGDLNGAAALRHVSRGGSSAPTTTQAPTTTTTIAPTTTQAPTTTTTIAPTTTQAPTTTTTGSVTNPQFATITVRVANGAGISGLAEKVTTYIGEEGFDVVAPVNATSSTSTTLVYYAPGFAVAAAAVASRLSLPLSSVKPDPSNLPVNAPPEDINVIAGPDVTSVP